MPLCKITPQATNRFCCLVIGQAGTGKTSLLRTIMGQEYDQESREWKQSREPTEKVLTLSAESGLLCVRDLVEQGMVEGYEIGSLQDFREAQAMLMTPEFRERYGWIFIDSLTEISSRCVEAMRMKHQSGSDTFKMWGEYNDAMTLLIKAFRDMRDYNVVFTCLESADTDDNRRRFLAPAISGSGMRYHTGSHADVTGFSLMTGAARNFPAPDGDFLLGAFFELGYASLGTFNSSEPGDINGRGHSRYLGGGLLTRFDVSASPLRGLYAEAAFRTGRLKMSWNSDDLTDNMDRAAAFDTSSPYYGGHAGMGYVRQITEKLRADTHIRYFWTRQDGQGTDMLGDRFDFDDADSHRLRLGTRLEYEASEGIVPYVGAAWEHEFDGTTRSSVAFYALDTPSVSMRGDSGVFDLGLDMKPASLPLTLSAGLRGSVGAREGIGGHMNVVFRF